MEFNTILYNISKSAPYLFAVVPGLIDLFILLKKDVSLNNKLKFVILVILLFGFIFIYTNNLVEMPKIVDEIYADAIITLNENKLTHKLINKEDVNNTNNWRVVYQSVSEGVIINKNIIISLVLEEIVEEDSINKDDNKITSNGDNATIIQNHEGGVIQINYNTDTTQSQTTERVKQNEDITSEVEKNETTTTKSTIVSTTIKNEIEIKETKPKETSVPLNNNSTTSSKTTTTPISTHKTTTILNTEWYETEINEILYIKIECYSRTKPIVGADAVKKYYVGTEINVIAATDTSFYKLADGTYIHTDYVSEQLPYETIPIEDNIEEYPYEQTQNYDWDSLWNDVFGN